MHTLLTLIVIFCSTWILASVRTAILASLLFASAIISAPVALLAAVGFKASWEVSPYTGRVVAMRSLVLIAAFIAAASALITSYL